MKTRRVDSISYNDFASQHWKTQGRFRTKEKQLPSIVVVLAELNASAKTQERVRERECFWVGRADLGQPELQLDP